MRGLYALVVGLAALTLLACGDDESSSSPADDGDDTQFASPSEIQLDVEPEFRTGAAVAAQSGCAACHQFGESGNDGPGPDLTHVGARLTRPEISRVLEVGPGIMPSYKDLSEKKRQDLTAFLASLE